MLTHVQSARYVVQLVLTVRMHGDYVLRVRITGGEDMIYHESATRGGDRTDGEMEMQTIVGVLKRSGIFMDLRQVDFGFDAFPLIRVSIYCKDDPMDIMESTMSALRI